MKVRRPKGDGRCVHCRERLVSKTKDHVFPASWYPSSTPPGVQRWTVPSCPRCNNESDDREKELFVRLALCVNPQKIEAAGMSRKAVESLGTGVAGLSPKEREYRRKLRDRVFSEAKLFTEASRPRVLPGLGPHPEVAPEHQIQIEVPPTLLFEVAKKVVRGCEFWLANGRIIDPPYELTVSFHDSEDMKQALRPIHRVYVGPGFRVRRGGAREDPLSAIYEVVAWDSWTTYAVILAED